VNRFKTVLFDLDGTLLNTLTDLAGCLNRALEKHGQETHPEERVRAFVGQGVRMLLIQALPGGEDNPLYAPIMADYRADYAVHGSDHVTIYEGIVPLLAELKRRGVTIGVVTNKPEKDAAPMIQKFFGDTFSLVVGKRPENDPKPAPDSVFIAMEALGATREDTLYVGDTEVDFKTAENAGIPCALVEWGFRSKAELDALGAFRVIAKPEELLNLIDN
jgi:phosphoglycolate phosphatase